MVPAVLCPKCGAKVRVDRKRCPRCRAHLVLPDPSRTAASSRKFARVTAIIVGLFAVGMTTLWLVREPAQTAGAGRPAPDPLLARRSAPPIAALPSTPAPAAVPRPYIEAAGEGSAAYAAGDYTASLAHYLAAVEKNPDDAESLGNVGQVLVRLNRTAEAIPYFDRAIAILPGRWAYHFNRARAVGLLGRTDEAIAGYRAAQQLFPDDYATAFNLAMALHQKGDEAAAVEQYRKAIALQPEDPSFRMALGISYEQLHNGQEAAAAYQEYLRLSPTAPDADKVRARIAQLQAVPVRETTAQAPGALVN